MCMRQLKAVRRMEEASVAVVWHKLCGTSCVAHNVWQPLEVTGISAATLLCCCAVSLAFLLCLSSTVLHCLPSTNNFCLFIIEENKICEVGWNHVTDPLEVVDTSHFADEILTSTTTTELQMLINSTGLKHA